MGSCNIDISEWQYLVRRYERFRPGIVDCEAI